MIAATYAPTTDARARCGLEATRRGWELEAIATEPSQLQRLLDQLDAGDYQALLIGELQHVARSLGAAAALIGRAGAGGWAVVVLAPHVDTTVTPWRQAAEHGSAFAVLDRGLRRQLSDVGQLEARARGWRPGENSRYEDTAVIRRILAWSQPSNGREPLSNREIARRLMREGIPAPGGGDVWYPRTIERLVIRHTSTGVE